MNRLLLAVTGFLALSGAASAQDITTSHLAALDANADGTVDLTEFDTYIAGAFEVIDTNDDGYITVVESSGYMTPEQFAAANTNGDDGLSQAELAAATRADFAKADLDGDGALN
jgi:hypothetical protein